MSLAKLVGRTIITGIVDKAIKDGIHDFVKYNTGIQLSQEQIDALSNSILTSVGAAIDEIISALKGQFL